MREEWPAGAAGVEGTRLPALDWMRGLMMVLMTVDHASSAAFNKGRLFTDGASLYQAGTALPLGEFLTRWITHLCAPTFVFLAGAALALSVEKQRARGVAPWAIDRVILARGALIAALDLLWMRFALTPGFLLFQVLYAIGVGMMAMVLLRRLSDRALLVAAVVLFVGGELLTGMATVASGGQPTLPVAFVLSGGRFGRIIVGYPLVPWLAMMMLGWSFGRWLSQAGAARAGRVLLVGGLASLAGFFMVRGLNGYGNMRLLRDDLSLAQWLHVSKYPPSLSYVLLELGLMALGLAVCFRLQRRGAPRDASPLLVFGQTALFFYLLHAHLLVVAAHLLHLDHRGGLPETYLATLGALVVLYPLCVLYGRYKRAHPTGWTRFI